MINRAQFSSRLANKIRIRLSLSGSKYQLQVLHKVLSDLRKTAKKQFETGIETSFRCISRSILFENR